MNILKTMILSNGERLSIVDNGNQYNICINCDTKAVEYDWDRACETFQYLADYYG